MTDANEKPEYLLAVDIECTGPQLDVRFWRLAPCLARLIAFL